MFDLVCWITVTPLKVIVIDRSLWSLEETGVGQLLGWTVLTRTVDIKADLNLNVQIINSLFNSRLSYMYCENKDEIKITKRIDYNSTMCKNIATASVLMDTI